jgi:transposase
MESTVDRPVETLAEARLRISELEAENTTLRNLAEQLLTEKKLAYRRLFAPSSETSDTEQLQLFNEAESSENSKAIEPDIATITYRRRKVAGKREADLAKFEHICIDYELPEDKRVCPRCKGSLHDMGVDVRRELSIIPAKIYVTEHAQHKYACRHCDTHDILTPVIRADAPRPFLPKTIASATLLAHLIEAKYTLALPLYRQEADWKAKGIEISRTNMANWICTSAQKLEPLYRQMKTDLRTHDVLHADETTCQVLKEPDRKPAAKSYMWLYRTGSDAKHPLIIYDWQKSRAACCAQDFLKDFRGYLHTDGYQAYHKLEGVTVTGCMAHVRRKFNDALSILPKDGRQGSIAACGLNFCNALFVLERQWTDLDPYKRFKLRIAQSKPIFEEFVTWARSVKVLPESAPGKALYYLLSQEPYLKNFYLDGRLELSNNRAERSIKPFVIGRKNWLFANSIKGARASATLYSIIETAKENNLKVFDYLTWLFEQFPNSEPERYPDLCPHSDSLPEELYVTQ